MKNLLTMLALSGLAVAGSAHASPELAKSKNCLACHASATKLAGPAFRAIAAKYGADQDAERTLAHKVRHGSAGVWGPMAMPPHPQVNEEDARTLVKWILSQK